MTPAELRTSGKSMFAVGCLVWGSRSPLRLRSVGPAAARIVWVEDPETGESLGSVTVAAFGELTNIRDRVNRLRLALAKPGETQLRNVDVALARSFGICTAGVAAAETVTIRLVEHDDVWLWE